MVRQPIGDTHAHPQHERLTRIDEGPVRELVDVVLNLRDHVRQVDPRSADVAEGDGLLIRIVGAARRVPHDIDRPVLVAHAGMGARDSTRIDAPRANVTVRVEQVPPTARVLGLAGDREPHLVPRPVELRGGIDAGAEADDHFALRRDNRSGREVVTVVSGSPQPPPTDRNRQVAEVADPDELVAGRRPLRSAAVVVDHQLQRRLLTRARGTESPAEQALARRGRRLRQRRVEVLVDDLPAERVGQRQSGLQDLGLDVHAARQEHVAQQSSVSAVGVDARDPVERLQDDRTAVDQAGHEVGRLMESAFAVLHGLHSRGADDAFLAGVSLDPSHDGVAVDDVEHFGRLALDGSPVRHHRIGTCLPRLLPIRGTGSRKSDRRREQRSHGASGPEPSEHASPHPSGTPTPSNVTPAWALTPVSVRSVDPSRVSRVRGWIGVIRPSGAALSPHVARSRHRRVRDRAWQPRTATGCPLRCGRRRHPGRWSPDPRPADRGTTATASTRQCPQARG